MTEPEAIDPVWDEPGQAVAEDGKVILDGPNGVACTMTANAAMATGRSLCAAAEAALRQAQQDNA